MEASLKKSGFTSYHKAYSRTLRKEESQDCVVPDTMPDIAELVTTWGSVLIRSKDVGEGRVRVEANVPAKVTFRPEEGEELCCLEVNIPLYFSAEDASIRDGAVCVADLKLRALEARPLNPRKVTVRAEAELCLDCYETGETVFSAAGEDCDRAIHVREQELVATAVDLVTEKTFVLTDELTLPEDQPAAAEILGQQTGVDVEDIKAVGSKVIVRGSLRSLLFYRCPEGTADTAEFSTDFSQIIDTDCETEDAYAKVCLLLSGIYYDVAPGYNGRTLRMEAHAVAQLTLCRDHSVFCLADAYSNVYALELRQECRELERIAGADMLRGMLREEIALPRAAAEVLHCTAQCLGAVPEEGGVALTLRVQLLCADADGCLFSHSQLLPASVAAECAAGETLQIHSITVRDPGAAPSARGAEVRAALEIGAYRVCCRELSCIQAICYDEAQLLDLSDKPSLVIMRVRSGDDLWQLARENCSTPEAIRETNGLEDQPEDWEKLLLIPRTL